MRIERLEELRRDGRIRVQARVAFEERERELPVWFETEAAPGADLEPSPEAFVTACLPVAKWTGERRVRIHAIGFPVRPDAPQYTSIRFATLMRILCAKNGGTFVGLDDPQRRPSPFRIGDAAAGPLEPGDLPALQAAMQQP